MPKKQEKIAGEQIRRMYGLAKQAGMNNDELHVMVYGICSKESIKDLTVLEADQVIARLKKSTSCNKMRSPNGEYRDVPAGMATIKQRDLIFALSRELGWDNTRLRMFLEKRFKTSHMSFLSDTKARKVIEALKAMKKGNRGERRKGDLHGAGTGLDAETGS